MDNEHSTCKKLREDLILLGRLAVDTLVPYEQLCHRFSEVFHIYEHRQSEEKRLEVEEKFDLASVALRQKLFERAWEFLQCQDFKTPQDLLSEAYRKLLDENIDVWTTRLVELDFGDDVPCEEDDCWYGGILDRISEFDGKIYIHLLAPYYEPGLCEVCHANYADPWIAYHNTENELIETFFAWIKLKTSKEPANQLNDKIIQWQEEYDL